MNYELRVELRIWSYELSRPCCPSLKSNFNSQLFHSQLSTLSVVPGRLELPTSTLSVWRSNQLSYRTMIHREESLPQNDSSRPVALPSLGATKARLPSFPMIKQTAAYKKLGEASPHRLNVYVPLARIQSQHTTGSSFPTTNT